MLLSRYGQSCLLSAAFSLLGAACVLSAVQHWLLQHKRNKRSGALLSFFLPFFFAVTWKEQSQETAKAEENKAKHTQMVSPQI